MGGPDRSRARTVTVVLVPGCDPPRPFNAQARPPKQNDVTIPRALAQALGIGKGHPAKWVPRGGDLVLRLRKA